MAKTFLQRDILQKKYMKKSNTNAGDAAKNFPRKEILLVTIRQYMKESNINAGIAVKNFPRTEVLLFTKGQYMKD